MKITEHEMRGLLSGKCIPGDMLVNEELPAYLVRKFDEIKAQRDALAAEVHNCRGFVADHLGPEAELQFSGLNTDFADSILNSVRADVIKQLHSEQKDWALVTWQHDSFDALKRAAVRHGDSELSGVIFMLDRIEGFAAQLRSGEPS